nr:hypothetical protein [Angustibacter aerolatus]
MVVDRLRDRVMASAARQVGPDADPTAFVQDREPVRRPRRRRALPRRVRRRPRLAARARRPCDARGAWPAADPRPTPDGPSWAVRVAAVGAR